MYTPAAVPYVREINGYVTTPGVWRKVARNELKYGSKKALRSMACVLRCIQLQLYRVPHAMWNVFMALLICYCGVMVPFEIAFEGSMISQMGTSGWLTWEICNLVVDCLFIFDLVVIEQCVSELGELVKYTRPVDAFTRRLHV